MSLVAILLAANVSAAQGPSRPTVALAETGWKAIEERRYADALEAFTAAAGPRTSDASVCTGAGFAAFMLGQDREAEEWLERALELAPRNTDAAVLLGELHHRAGRIAEAIAIYEKGTEFAPDERIFREKLDQWRKDVTVRATAYESRGAHFSVLFQGAADETIARRAVEMLEEAYWRIGTALTTYPARTLTVVLYTEEQFRDVTRSPAWAAGAYDGTIRLPTRGALERPEELERILAHEFVHAVVATIGGSRVPTWLNEGLASMLEPGADARDASPTTESMPLVRLERGFDGLAADDARRAYATSERAVVRMAQLRGAPAIVALLEDIRRGVPFSSAFHQRMSMRYEDFQMMIERQ